MERSPLFVVAILVAVFLNLLVQSSAEAIFTSNLVGIQSKPVENFRTSRRWRKNPIRGFRISPETTNTDNFESNPLNHNTQFIAECKMPTHSGNFRMRSYEYNSSSSTMQPVVVISGEIEDKENVIVRVHDQCLTSEVFGSLRCDCKDQLDDALKMINNEGGIIIYLQQEGRGIGLSNKLAAYSLQDQGFDTVDANLQLGFKEEQREYFCVADILKDLSIKSIRLATNNPYKIDQLLKLGVNVTERISAVTTSNPHNVKYLQSKRERMQHFLPVNSKRDETHPSESQARITNPGYAFGKASVEAAIRAISEGKIVMVVDDENRENEGDLIMAAELATPETIGFIVRYSSGVICVSMESERLNQLQLPPMVTNNECPKQTAYSVSVDYKHNTTTGISAYDRAACFRALANPTSDASDFQRPGHVFPLCYSPGGVLVRAGHTEASLDLAKLAGLQPAGVLAEIVNDDGSMMRLPGLRVMAREHNLVLTSVQDIIAYRFEMENRN